MRKIIASTVCVLALAISATAFAQAAQTKKEAAFKIQYDIPATSRSRPRTTSRPSTSRSHEIAFFIELSDETNPAKAMSGLDAVTTPVVTNVKAVGGARRRRRTTAWKP